MADRQAQEFWDQMWYWERYEKYPEEQRDDPHLVLMLGTQIDDLLSSGRQPDADLMGRFDHCVGRVLERLTNLFPRNGDQVALDEVRLWLRFGIDKAHRGHDGVPVPIIDADSLVYFLTFTRYAMDYCRRHQLQDLGRVWASIDQVAQEVEREHGGKTKASRFDPSGS